MTAGHNNPCSYNAITKNDELLLWQNNVFDLNTSKGLSYAVFYYVGKVFGVRLSIINLKLNSFLFSLMNREAMFSLKSAELKPIRVESAINVMHPAKFNIMK